MDGKVLIRSIYARNMLSFGPEAESTHLEPLNVLVGSNGSGKSNFIELFRLLNAAPSDINHPVAQTGGFGEWVWKGESEKNERNIFQKLVTLSAVVMCEDFSDIFREQDFPVEYSLSLNDYQRLTIANENLLPLNGDNPDFYYKFSRGTAVIYQWHPVNEEFGVFTSGIARSLNATEFKPNLSILSQRNDPGIYPQITFIAEQFSSIRLYTDAYFGRLYPARRPQDAALDGSSLFEDSSNLALVLNDLQNQPQVMKKIVENLKLFYERVENIITRVQGGTVQIYFQEEGLTQTVPATRLSDGTLRYLCLLVLLLHPTPPPLMCIEEPELGMHPDIIPVIADLLIGASQRTQLIVTTHSSQLVSAIGATHPEAVVVCDRTSKGTTLTRLESDKLQDWLQDYSLGEVWLKGAIGGTRY